MARSICYKATVALSEAKSIEVAAIDPVGRDGQGGVGGPGRANQRERTRRGIVDACRTLIESGGDVTMPLVAQQALVSEATAYRYFPDLPSLVRVAVSGLWPTAEVALQPVAHLSDPVDRVAFAADALLRRVLAYQGSTRAMIADTITQPGRAQERPRIRFGFIDEALDPVAEHSGISESGLVNLKRQLSVVISPESLFALIDSADCSDDEAISCIVDMARLLTAAASR
jgi:AcrR family transcriptional regulator